MAFIGRRSFVPRPLSAATVFSDTEDDMSDFDSQHDSVTTVSSPASVRTPTSAGLGGFDFHFDEKPVSGPQGPHLFTASDGFQPIDLDTYYEYIEPETTVAHRKSIGSLSRAVAELDETQVRVWSPRQVASWMAGAGFEESVVSKFLTHDISGSILLDLQFEDLKELDITSFGKRHRVMSSIQHLRNSSVEAFTVPARRGRSTAKTSPISPAESVSIVAIEQVIPKPHHCSKGENCSKWRRQQREIQEFHEEFPDVQTIVSASAVASSDVLGQSELPKFRLSPETLQELCPRDAQQNVREFITLQHIESTKPSAMAEKLRGLPRLHTPKDVDVFESKPMSSAKSIRHSRTPISAIRRTSALPIQWENAVEQSPMTYRMQSPMSEVDVPVTALPIDPIGRNEQGSQSVPAEMRYGHQASYFNMPEPIERPQSARPARELFRAPGPQGEPMSAPALSSYTHAGPMRKRKTNFLRHDWTDGHFVLDGTSLEMYPDASAAARQSRVMDIIDVDNYAVACSTAASSNKLTAAFKRKNSNDDKAFAFTLVPADKDGERKFFATQKSHHFSVKSKDERMDWMRELMLAKALKKGKAMGNEIKVNGNLI